MNIKDLAIQSINEIKSKWIIPKEGFIAGGALANLVWEKVSGNKAIINDIDIFKLNKIIDTNPTSNDYVRNGSELVKLFNHTKEPVFNENYDGMMKYSSRTKNYYLIDNVQNEGIFNYIYYNSNKNDYNIILELFDINCTQIGYSIEDNEFYWTKEFEEFLLTGNLKIINLQTPSHTSIRIIKKKDELKANLDDVELHMCQSAIHKNYTDIVKRFFSDKYAESYIKYKDELDKLYRISRNRLIENLIKDKKGLDIRIFELNINDSPKLNVGRRLYSGDELIFYIRSVEKNENLKMIWEKIPNIVNREDYVDCEVVNKDVDFLARLIEVSPKSINNLRGLTLSKQLKMVNNILNKFKDDPIIGISVLENLKIDYDNDFDENDLLILELMVRKEIVNDTNRKVDRLFNNMNPMDYSILF